MKFYCYTNRGMLDKVIYRKTNLLKDITELKSSNNLKSIIWKVKIQNWPQESV